MSGARATRARTVPPATVRSSATPRVNHATMLDQGTRAADQWLATLQELARRTSHEIKNALNGVAVNLEVLRSRLERGAAQGDATAGTVAPFARSASEQLDQLSALTDAFLMLARPLAAGPVELGPVVTRVVRLTDAIARADGRCVALSVAGDGAGLRTSASGDVARWIVVRLLLDGLACGHSLAVRVEPGPWLYVRSATETDLPAPDADLVEAAAGAGVRLECEAGAWRAGFPAVDA